MRKLGLLLVVLCVGSCKEGTTQFTEVPEEDPEEVAASPITSPRTTVDALIFDSTLSNGERIQDVYPVSGFRNATGPECDGAPHWHSDRKVPSIGYLARQGSETLFVCDHTSSSIGVVCKEDPAPTGCGHGKVSEVTRQQVQLFQECLDAWFQFSCP